VKQLISKGIILSRTDYGEADRIITILTPEYGKLRLIAKGVRKSKSKLAGGIELFSVSDIGFINGRGEVGTLVSSRLDRHYGKIVHDIDRVQLGYDLIKLLNRATEDHLDSWYFTLLEHAFIGLDDDAISLLLINTWFRARLLKMAGHMPNLVQDEQGDRLKEDLRYNFDIEAMTFAKHDSGRYYSKNIKFLRLVFSDNSLEVISKVRGADQVLAPLAKLVESMYRQHVRD
jgi:DNA repair protein RecO